MQRRSGVEDDRFTAANAAKADQAGPFEPHR